jgi:hypothetical protein
MKPLYIVGAVGVAGIIWYFYSKKKANVASVTIVQPQAQSPILGLLNSQAAVAGVNDLFQAATSATSADNSGDFGSVDGSGY